MNNFSDMVPTLGLAEENRELREKLALYELGMVDTAEECEVALALMASEQHIEVIELAEETWLHLSSLEKRRYMQRAQQFAAALSMVHNAPAL